MSAHFTAYRKWLLLLTPVSSLQVLELLRRNVFDERSLRLETQQCKGRIYANASKLTKYLEPVTRDELFTSPYQPRQSVGITAPYRFGVALAGYATYPSMVDIVRNFLPDATLGEASALTSNFIPAVSLLYGAWLSITFAILEERISSLQRTATEESALLGALCRRTAMVIGSDLPQDKVTAVFAPIFEQTTILATKSREEELLKMANDDVYRRYLAAVTSCDLTTHFNGLADVVDKLSSQRAVRLAQETNSLPAEHFAILAVFSVQLLLSFVYVAAASPNDPETGGDNAVLRVAFTVFVAFFLLVFNFALDLNDPFRGNYQIRRSAINANLIATRRLTADIVGPEIVREWDSI